MHEVRKVFKIRAGFYATESVMDFIRGSGVEKDGERHNPVALKIRFLVESEFKNAAALGPEYGKAKRIMVGGKFRIIGFFDGLDFIAIAWFEKKRQDLSPAQRKLCQEIDGIREKGHWKRVDG